MSSFFTLTAEQQAERDAVAAQVKPMCEEFNLDVHAMTSAVLYLKSVVADLTPEQARDVAANPQAFITVGMQKFAERSKQFYTQLLNDSEMRRQFSEDLYYELRRKQGIQD